MLLNTLNSVMSQFLKNDSLNKTLPTLSLAVSVLVR